MYMYILVYIIFIVLLDIGVGFFFVKCKQLVFSPESELFAIQAMYAPYVLRELILSSSNDEASIRSRYIPRDPSPP